MPAVRLLATLLLLTPFFTATVPNNNNNKYDPPVAHRTAFCCTESGLQRRCFFASSFVSFHLHAKGGILFVPPYTAADDRKLNERG